MHERWIPAYQWEEQCTAIQLMFHEISAKVMALGQERLRDLIQKTPETYPGCQEEEVWNDLNYNNAIISNNETMELYKQCTFVISSTNARIESNLEDIKLYVAKKYGPSHDESLTIETKIGQLLENIPQHAQTSDGLELAIL